MIELCLDYGGYTKQIDSLSEIVRGLFLIDLYKALHANAAYKIQVGVTALVGHFVSS